MPATQRLVWWRARIAPAAVGVAVELDATDLRMARVAVQFYIRAHVLSKCEVPPAADRLAGHLEQAVSDIGQQCGVPSQQWLTTQQVAERLGCSQRAAQRIATKCGTRFGRQLLTPADALPEDTDGH